MSGHSKWSTIKRKKGAADTKRGAVFTKHAGAITVAAKNGGGDPATNFSLRLAIDRAKNDNLPTANIDRAIKRGTGELAGEKAPEEVTYEAYGPGGIALLVDCLTDNRNRTVSDVRSAITKYGGSLGETGSVAYLFSKKGVLTVAKQNADADALTLAAADAGASDVTEEEQLIEIETDKKNFRQVKEALEQAGFAIESAELTYVASASVTITDQAAAGSIVKLVTALEDLDDVVAVSTNAEIEPELVRD